MISRLPTIYCLLSTYLTGTDDHTESDLKNPQSAPRNPQCRRWQILRFAPVLPGPQILILRLSTVYYLLSTFLRGAKL